MRKSITIISLMILSNLYCFSQDSADDFDKKQTGQHTVYVELFGNAGLWYSIGYDYTLKLKGKNKLSFNCGFQCTPYGEKTYMLALAPQFSYLYGKNHHLELGIGATYGLFCVDMYIDDMYWVIPFRIGYRYQRENGGFFFKIAYTPFLTNKIFFSNGEWWAMPLWGGVAIGYTFKGKK